MRLQVFKSEGADGADGGRRGIKQTAPEAVMLAGSLRGCRETLKLPDIGLHWETGGWC